MNHVAALDFLWRWSRVFFDFGPVPRFEPPLSRRWSALKIGYCADHSVKNEGSSLECEITVVRHLVCIFLKLRFVHPHIENRDACETPRSEYRYDSENHSMEI